MGTLGELVGEGDGLLILAADLDLLYPLAVHEHVMVTCALVREHRCYAAARKPGLHVHACPVVAHATVLEVLHTSCKRDLVFVACRHTLVGSCGNGATHTNHCHEG